MKETIISITIILSILILDIASQNYTKKAVDDMNNCISTFRDQINNADAETLQKSVDNINIKWKGYNKKMSLYIEHNELEKVETYLSGYENYVYAEDKQVAFKDIDQTEFMLEHISNKYKFTLENIF